METMIERTQLQTIGWIHYAALKKGADPNSPSDLEKKTGIRKQYWSRYWNWGYNWKDNPPNEKIRNKLEAGDPDEGIEAIKGSKNVYDIGPENAPLWAALQSENKQELWDAVKSVSQKVLIYKAATSLDSGKLGGYDYTKLKLENVDIYIEALIEYTSTTHSATTLSHSPTYNLLDLSALIAAYRLSYFNFPENGERLESLSKCINNIFNNKHTRKSLSTYGILDYVTQILQGLIPGLFPKTTSPTLAPHVDYEFLATEFKNKFKNKEITPEDFDCDFSDIIKTLNKGLLSHEEMHKCAVQFYDRLNHSWLMFFLHSFESNAYNDFIDNYIISEDTTYEPRHYIMTEEEHEELSDIFEDDKLTGLHAKYAGTEQFNDRLFNALLIFSFHQIEMEC